LASKRREFSDLKLFRDIEAKQGNSKLFWGKVQKLSAKASSHETPPPICVDALGNTVTDPLAVLRAWRSFSASIASNSFEGTKEEGIYCEDFEAEEKERFERMRLVKVNQPWLDRPIGAREIFDAVRKLRMGTAPGEDGLLPDIIKTAADAFNNNKTRGNNTVIEALQLLFNFVFEREVWPERWSSGMIFPLYKADSRLDPSNYRPITLLSVVGKLFGSVINARLMKWSERTHMVHDEQGGFRPARGSPDQIFILREILSSRKERGLPTYVTYIDARKAYDTVWREAAYARIHDGGVRGKLWRQLQAMHGNLKRKVIHPLGMSEPFEVERGMAQGAVESPWVYSAFIDGMATDMQSAGHGVWVAGRRVPLLMYADDIILLASSPRELTNMNRIATNFARRNRFQFNGSKSGVMAFGVSGSERDRLRAMHWELFGEKVEVKDKYKYLGTWTVNNDGNWNEHMKQVISEAEKRSTELSWICRRDRGIRPRTAATLWNSLIRPVLEYSSEIWSGLISQEQVKAAEAVQMRFLRTTLGLRFAGKGVSDDMIRAEVGAELLEARWAKLRLGYWRRLQEAPSTRLLKAVCMFRVREIKNLNGQTGFGSRSGLRATEQLLTEVGLARYWSTPSAATYGQKKDWKALVYENVDDMYDNRRASRMALRTITRASNTGAQTLMTIVSSQAKEANSDNMCPNDILMIELI
jgi:hypothetical protein